MRLSISILLCVLLCSYKAKAQSELIKPYIKAWKVDDQSQTHKAEETYSLLKNKRDKQVYERVVK
jgi:hypothetical protein